MYMYIKSALMLAQQLTSLSLFILASPPESSYHCHYWTVRRLDGGWFKHLNWKNVHTLNLFLSGQKVPEDAQYTFLLEVLNYPQALTSNLIHAVTLSMNIILQKNFQYLDCNLFLNQHCSLMLIIFLFCSFMCHCQNYTILPYREKAFWLKSFESISLYLKNETKIKFW